MTRGNFGLIEDGKVYVSIQFNGNMQPGYNGKFVYYLLQKLDSKGELKKAVKRFDDLKISRRILATSVVQLGGFLINKNIVYACSGNEPVTASYHDF